MEKFNRLYSKRESGFGPSPEEIVLKGAELIPVGSKILDVGAGQGRNILALASKGFKCVAIDTSDVGISQIEKLSIENNLDVQTLVGDVKDGIEGEYDMIISNFMLHTLAPEAAIKCIEMIKSHTKEQGLNVLSAFTKEGDFFKIDGGSYFYPELGELKQLYHDWEIIEYNEEEVETTKKWSDDTPMHNIKSEILARKV